MVQSDQFNRPIVQNQVITVIAQAIEPVIEIGDKADVEYIEIKESSFNFKFYPG